MLPDHVLLECCCHTTHPCLLEVQQQLLLSSNAPLLLLLLLLLLRLSHSSWVKLAECGGPHLHRSLWENLCIAAV